MRSCDIEAQLDNWELRLSIPVSEFQTSHWKAFFEENEVGGRQFDVTKRDVCSVVRRRVGEGTEGEKALRELRFGQLDFSKRVRNIYFPSYERFWAQITASLDEAFPINEHQYRTILCDACLTWAGFAQKEILKCKKSDVTFSDEITIGGHTAALQHNSTLALREHAVTNSYWRSNGISVCEYRYAPTEELFRTVAGPLRQHELSALWKKFRDSISPSVAKKMTRKNIYYSGVFCRIRQVRIQKHIPVSLSQYSVDMRDAFRAEGVIMHPIMAEYTKWEKGFYQDMEF